MKLKYYNMLLGALLIASCSKKIEVTNAPDFNVTTDSATYKAGQEVTFNIKDNGANIISFYSGETLHDYAFKDGRTIDVKGAGATMAFTSSVQLGTQVNQLSVMASTDFNGDYSSLANVKAATWTDITSRFALGTGTAFLASGTKDISDLMVPGKPIYIAYKYVTKPQATNGLARDWFIQSFAINSLAILANTASATPIALTLADQIHAGFRIIDQNAATIKSATFIPYDMAPAQASSTGTRITLYGNRYLTPILPIFDSTNSVFDPKNPIYDPYSLAYVPTAVRPIFVLYDPASPYNDPLSEHWAVSAPINADKVDLGPDLATVVKSGITSANLDVFKYTYTTAGTFTAVFVASNNSIDGIKQVVKTITLTITP